MAQSALRALLQGGPAPAGMASAQTAIQNAAQRPQPKPMGQQVADVLGGVALPLSTVPFLGDIAGLGADAAMYANYPEERTALNYGLTLAGMLPFVPGAAGVRAAEGAISSGQRIVQPKPGDFPVGFENRVGELRKIYETPMRYSGSGITPPPISIYDLEGRQFVTSMADRSDAGTSIVGIGDVDFDIPVELRGGQGYMFNNPGELWAAAKGPSGLIQSTADMAFNAAALAGRTDAPLYIPYRMGAPSGDFSHHTTDTMLTYARNSMPQNMIKRVNAEIATVMPDFLGIENPNSMRQLSSVPNRQRQEVRNILDKKFRDQGGIGIGQARLAISDPAQYNAMTGGIQNVGQFDISRRIAPSNHPSYPYSIPGEGLGALVEKDISIYDLLPDLAIARGVDPSMPIPQSEMYTLQTGLKGVGQPNQIDPTGKARPFVGIITDKVLRNIERKRGQQ